MDVWFCLSELLQELLGVELSVLFVFVSWIVNSTVLG